MKKYLLFFVVAIVLFFSHALYTKHGVYGDGNGYYSYTQALYFDKGLAFGPVYEHLRNFEGRNYIFSRIFWDTSVGPKGVLGNPYMIGAGVLWVPSLLFISAVNFVFGLGVGRFDLIYELGPGISGILFILFGLYFLEKYLGNFVSGKSASWTIIALFFGSYVFYYTALEPALSHQPSFFLICFLLWFTKGIKINKANSFILGALFGLLAIVRVVDVILLIPVIFNILGRKPKVKDLVFGIPGVLLGASPQLIYQYYAYGTVLMNNYFICSGCFWRFDVVHFLQYLASPVRGLFVWSPLFVIGFWGLVKKRAWVVVGTMVFFWVVTSSWPAYLSAGFGQRYAFSQTPYFALGIAYLFERRKEVEKLLYIIPFALWNGILFIVFYVLRLTRSI
ncbi:MAG TPA: hypothetical protein VJ227_02975 [Patescibacteria group bacterium]|nr:hypothetical protein [Patescibacteria group bacterium]